MTNSGSPSRGAAGTADPRGARTRQLILDAAAALVAEQGWTAVTTRAIAGRAGVNPALVHYHFGTKAELLRAAVIHALDRELEAAVGPLLGNPSILAGIDEAVAAIESFDTTSPAGILLAEALLRATRDAVLRDALATDLEQARTALSARVADGIRAGEVRGDVAPEAVAVLVVALLDGIYLHRLASPAIDLGTIRAALLTMLASPAHPVPAGRLAAPSPWRTS